MFKGEDEALDYVRRLVNLSYKKYDDLLLKETIDSLTESEYKYLCTIWPQFLLTWKVLICFSLITS